MTEQQQPQQAIVIPAGSVVITPSQMYDEQRATHEAVTRIEQIVSPIPSRLATLEDRFEKLAGLPQEAEDHEKRLRVLEHWQWRAAGIATALAAIVGAAAGLLSGRVG